MATMELIAAEDISNHHHAHTKWFWEIQMMADVTVRAPSQKW